MVTAATVFVMLAPSQLHPAGPNSATPLLVELFTSEGCSSCPPADAFLRDLDSKQPLPGVQVIVLEEHVDYWDDQGWRDPFSSHEFTLRQVEYTQHLHVAGPYTPEMVVNGAYELVGSDRTRAAQAFQKALALTTVPIRITSVSLENGKVHAHVETGPPAENVEVWAVLALDHAESQVSRGENGGHHLDHVAVAKKLSKIGKAEKGQTFSKDVVLDLPPGPCRFIAFLQDGQGRILGAALQKLSK